jgi:hypothetical protein
MAPGRIAIVAAAVMVMTACGGGSPRAVGAPRALVSGRPAARPQAPASTAATSTTSTTAPEPRLPIPPPIAPLARPALAGEGAWQPAPGSAVAGGYAIYTAQLRPAAGFPAAGIAWIDRSATRLALYAGTSEPYGTWPHQGYVSPADQSQLLAAFNSGFKIYAYHTGWYDGGRAALAPQPGYASLVIYADGTATVGEWGRDVTFGPNVESVRQNLPLLVDHGAPAANAAVVGYWGAVLGGSILTWRSGIGVTAGGDLVYAGGPALSPALLADLLVAAGAVRAMELDINPEWVSFATYSHSAGAVSGGADLVSGMYFPASHYLQPDSRDFFAVFARS